MVDQSMIDGSTTTPGGEKIRAAPPPNESSTIRNLVFSLNSHLDTKDEERYEIVVTQVHPNWK